MQGFNAIFRVSCPEKLPILPPSYYELLFLEIFVGFESV
jgi:hypothetical protein